MKEDALIPPRKELILHCMRDGAANKLLDGVVEAVEVELGTRRFLVASTEAALRQKREVNLSSWLSVASQRKEDRD